MTGADDRDEGMVTAGEDEPAVGAMHFTVLDRRGDRVHLVSVEADTDTLYGHPSVCEQVWQEALADVPQNWDVVDLCPRPSGPSDRVSQRRTTRGGLTSTSTPPAGTTCSWRSSRRASTAARRSPS